MRLIISLLSCSIRYCCFFFNDSTNGKISCTFVAVGERTLDRSCWRHLTILDLDRELKSANMVCIPLLRDFLTLCSELTTLFDTEACLLNGCSVNSMFWTLAVADVTDATSSSAIATLNYSTTVGDMLIVRALPFCGLLISLSSYSTISRSFDSTFGCALVIGLFMWP
jgi:hypothetical protein